MLNTAKSVSFYETSTVTMNTCPVTGEPMPCFIKTMQQLTMQTIHMYCWKSVLGNRTTSRGFWPPHSPDL